jgi:hypothetical protein
MARRTTGTTTTTEPGNGDSGGGSNLGFESNELRVALADALRGRSAELERLLSALGAVVTARPNVKLAAAFGAEMAACKGAVAPLLDKLGLDDAAPDTNRAFLPIAAAHGWAGRIRAGREVEPAYMALAALAADERAPVRLGTRDALLALGVRPGGADELITRAQSWLAEEGSKRGRGRGLDGLADARELRFGTAGLVLELLAERRFLASVQDYQAVLDYLDAAIALVADAPRSAERSEARRRLLLGLPAGIAAVVGLSGAHGPRGLEWLEGACVAATHPQVRHALSDTLVRLRAPAFGQPVATVDRLQQTLAGSAKPLRDPTRVRQGLGRGKATRRTR